MKAKRPSLVMRVDGRLHRVDGLSASRAGHGARCTAFSVMHHRARQHGEHPVAHPALPVDGKPVTILDLSAVPSEILNVTVSVLCRLLFDFAVWSDGAIPILLVCEEAHRYAPEDDKAGFGSGQAGALAHRQGGPQIRLVPVRRHPAAGRVGGRMLSQCNTIFTMRLSHQRDQELVRAALSDAAIGLLEALRPSQRRGHRCRPGASPCPCAWSSNRTDARAAPQERLGDLPRRPGRTTSPTARTSSRRSSTVGGASAASEKIRAPLWQLEA